MFFFASVPRSLDSVVREDPWQACSSPSVSKSDDVTGGDADVTCRHDVRNDVRNDGVREIRSKVDFTQILKMTIKLFFNVHLKF